MEYNSFSQLRRLKLLAGVGIDRSGIGSSYILESKIKRDIDKAYADDPMLNTKFYDLLGKKDTHKVGVFKRIEKMEDWQLKAIRQCITEQSVQEAIALCYTLRKSERSKYVQPEREDEAFTAEPIPDENFSVNTLKNICKHK